MLHSGKNRSLYVNKFHVRTDFYISYSNELALDFLEESYLLTDLELNVSLTLLYHLLRMANFNTTLKEFKTKFLNVL